MVGHERFSGLVAGQALAQLLQAVRLYVNYFQPSFKLRERVREGSKVKKSYYPPATPCERNKSDWIRWNYYSGFVRDNRRWRR